VEQGDWALRPVRAWDGKIDRSLQHFNDFPSPL